MKFIGPALSGARHAPVLVVNAMRNESGEPTAPAPRPPLRTIRKGLVQTWSWRRAKFPTACGGDRQEGGPACGGVWQRHGLACGGVRQTCGTQFLIPLVLFSAPPHHVEPPRWCARVPWLRDRAPSQAAMAVAMAHNCRGLCLAGVWRRLGSRLAGSGKMGGSRPAACGLPHAWTKSGPVLPVLNFQRGGWHARTCRLPYARSGQCRSPFPILLAPLHDTIRHPSAALLGDTEGGGLSVDARVRVHACSPITTPENPPPS